MAFEIIKNIVEAEKEVDSIKTKAVYDAENIKSSAKARAEQMLVDAKSYAKEAEKQLINEAVLEGRKEVEKIIAIAEEECSKVKADAAGKKAAAVTAVIGKVVGINGDS